MIQKIIPALLYLFLVGCQNESRYKLKARLLERKIILTDSLVKLQMQVAFYEGQKRMACMKNDYALAETSLNDSVLRYAILEKRFNEQIKKIQFSLDSLNEVKSEPEVKHLN